ncbi:hypothetical protein [Algoriphagus sp.]|uniref:hypothetical protein n=1 Tax=Algoriphagus sp. TaxID=1872435 RepID=UPI0032914DE7
MHKLPKLKEFKAPDTYFDHLPDEIMEKIKPQRTIHWMKYAAAAAMVIISLGVWQFSNTNQKVEVLSMDEEVAFYIDSQYWTAEDVLSMVDNPEEILDQIIVEEMAFEVDVIDENDQNWY